MSNNGFFSSRKRTGKIFTIDQDDLSITIEDLDNVVQGEYAPEPSTVVLSKNDIEVVRRLADALDLIQESKDAG